LAFFSGLAGKISGLAGIGAYWCIYGSVRRIHLLQKRVAKFAWESREFLVGHQVASNQGAVGVRYSYIICSAVENEFRHIETVPFLQWSLHRYGRSYGDRRDTYRRPDEGEGYNVQRAEKDMVQPSWLISSVFQISFFWIFCCVDLEDLWLLNFLFSGSPL
jgi:hypothetical protein